MDDEVIVPKVFGWQHLVYLAIFLAVAAGGLVLFRLKAKDKAADICIRAGGAVLLVLIVWNRISIAVFKDNWYQLIPESLCGVTSVALGICAIVCKRDALPFHCLCYIGLLGGAANVIYPYYVAQAPDFMLPATISGLMHHSVALVLSIMMIMSGWFKPSLKKYYALPVGLCLMLTYGILLIDGLGVGAVGEKGFASAMNIFSPLVPGSFFTWYLVLPLMCALILGLLLLYEKVYLKRKAAGVESEAGEIPASE